MLFNFSLLPLRDIQPWGEPGNHHLSWFGLTDGQYWIEAGESTLFEYSELVRRQVGASQYCEYQLARLYEDVMAMVPSVLEPVPSSLHRYIGSDQCLDWWKRRILWLDENADRLGDDRKYELNDASGSWVGSRVLDSLYLRPPTSIHLWSDDISVHIEWDNRDRLVEGTHAWSALRGSHRMPREQFILEVRSFHERLMSQMTERVEQVIAGALPAGIHVDIEGLRQEHAKRCLLDDSVFEAPACPTDWERVHEALQEIERA